MKKLQSPFLAYSESEKLTALLIAAYQPTGPFQQNAKLSLAARKQALLFVLQQLRKLKGLTQTELADRLGMQQAALSRLESGASDPTLGTLMKLCAALEVDLMLRPIKQSS